MTRSWYTSDHMHSTNVVGLLMPVIAHFISLADITVMWYLAIPHRSDCVCHKLIIISHWWVQKHAITVEAVETTENIRLHARA